MTTQVFKLSLQGKTYDSGVLLAGGQYILTVAHLFNTNSLPSDLTITNANAQSVGHATAIYIHPNWKNDPKNYDHDLALIKLDRPLTGGYDIYRGTSEIGQSFSRIGYIGTNLVEGKNTYDAYTTSSIRFGETPLNLIHNYSMTMMMAHLRMML